MIQKFKGFISESTQKPDMKYPIEKCLNLESSIGFIKSKYKIDPRNLQPEIETFNKYHDFNFLDFLTKKLGKNKIFPKYNYEHAMNDTYMRLYKTKYTSFGEVILENDSIWLIPEFYDNKDDLADFHLRKIKFHEEMKKNMGDKYNEETIENNVNYGPQDFSWANIFLEPFHKEFHQHFNNGHIKCWWDKDSVYTGKEIWDYPWDKMYFYSDIIKYCSDKYGIEDPNNEFYAWILNFNFIEGRYWEVPLSISNYEKKEIPLIGFRKNKASETVTHILNVISKDLEDGYSNHREEHTFYIYIDVRISMTDLKDLISRY